MKVSANHVPFFFKERDITKYIYNQCVDQIGLPTVIPTTFHTHVYTCLFT